MSAILLNEGLIHYEVFGRGPPVILLHGWLGSWRYWMPTMEALAQDFRTYALDFWGFGDSDKPGDLYTIEDYVHLVSDFMDGLGIPQAFLVGHSLGGVVALCTALSEPNRVSKLVLIDTPLQGGALSTSLKLVRSPFSRILARPNTLIKMWMRALKRVSSDWTEMYEEIVEDTAKLDHDAVHQSVENMLSLDLSSKLGQLYIHSLVVYGERDEFVDPKQADLFANGSASTTQVFVLSDCRHFPFLDEPSKFNRLLQEFLKSDRGDELTVKEAWKRRFRQTEYL
ncbi:MAG: alpha/beta hydrolase [Chloroflexia bacterium]|nr:alpha/beta hydrolase [Chloroflexia bacterium]